MAGKKLINSVPSVVSDACQGLLLSTSDLAQVGELNIVVRADIERYKQDHVSLISGGGSGHEPAHAGYCGVGMLSAAVLGNVYASPSVSQILAAIRTCTGPKGTLLIIKNYTGDRLNFGMALEKAKAEGFKVAMVVVADDCALPEGKGITGGRGVAGTVFVHKIAGAAAAAGLSLEEVTAKAQAASVSLGSLGIALTTCTIPGAPPSTRLDEKNKYEVGLGIHGEPGRETRFFSEGATNNADSVADTLVEAILDRMRIGSNWAVASVMSGFFGYSGQPVAIMLNNLGALPAIELYVVARRVIKALKGRGLAVVRVYIGAFMTALDMSGLSLTVFKVNADQMIALDAATSAPGWVPATALDGTGSSKTITYSEDSFATSIRGGPPCPGASRIAAAVARAIIDNEPELTRCDSVCGDGDCGIVMKAGATAILALSSGALVAAEADAAGFCDLLATTISSSMGGTSGALLELFFRAAANSFANASGPRNWSDALSAGVEAMSFYGGASVGMRTMLDALVPAVAAFSAATAQRATAVDAASVARAAAEAAQAGADATKTMGSLAGRSNYVNEGAMRGTPDPGALAVAVAFAAAEKSL
jgi:dihydroxyacetone kinase